MLFLLNLISIFCSLAFGSKFELKNLFRSRKSLSMAPDRFDVQCAIVLMIYVATPDVSLVL